MPRGQSREIVRQFPYFMMARSSQDLSAEDDATMANEMALEKKIDLLVDKVDGLSTKLDGVSTRVDGLSTKFDGMSTRVDGVSTRLDGLSTKFDDLSTRVNTVSADVTSLKGDVGELKTKVAVGFDETHRLIRLSLEGLAGLEETTVERFDKMEAEHGEQFSLLETFGKHVRRRVEKLETPAARRRR